MGIQGLLPTLKSIMAPVHVRAYCGKRAAIDTYSWLHKAAYTCSRDLCEGRSIDRLVDYCMHRVNLLRHFGVQPVLVFDGGLLPMKADQEAKRARSRKEHLERAREHERLGNPSAAYACYQRAVDITPALAAALIKVLRREGVQYVVAPYEADAQMAYLVFAGLADVVITEDSDLIAYGCPRVLFKMNKSGQGEEFVYDDLARNKDLNFCNFTKKMVLEMCVMTGCDYLPSLPGMGVKKAHGLLRRFKGYQKVIRHLRFSGVTVSPQYEELFERALLTFCHQRVYDPVRQEMLHLTDVPSDAPSDLQFLGPELPQKVVKAIADGEMDPTSQLPFEVAVAATAVRDVPKAVHERSADQSMARKPLESLSQRNVLTNYFSSESQDAKRQFKSPRTVPHGYRQGASGPQILFEGGSSDSPVKAAEEAVKKRAPSYFDAAEVFGTPLPDDDEDSDAETPKEEAHSDFLGGEERAGVGGKSGVLQDTSASSVLRLVSSDGRLSAKEGQKFRVDETGVRLSGYFSYSPAVRKKADEPIAADVSVRATQAETRDAAKKSKLDFHESAGAGLSHPGSRPDFELWSHAAKSSQLPPPVIGNPENRPSSHGATSGEAGRAELATFSTDVSHVSHFAHIARASVDRFVNTIAPFRCSKGARASGLRAPLKAVPANTAARIPGNDPSNLNQFSWQSSGIKRPTFGLNPSHPRLVTTGARRHQENSPISWS